MKMTWKKTSDSKSKTRKRPAISFDPNLPFEDLNSSLDTKEEGESLGNDDVASNKKTSVSDKEEEDEGKRKNLSQDFEAQGNKLAEEGKYQEALGKWETAITLMPERAVLHEQKAQVLLELGDAWKWNALKAATRATELEPRWAEAWITLGRAQLNFGEPDCAIESFDKALAIKPGSEVNDDRQTALDLVKKRKQLHTTGLSSTESRFLVRDHQHLRSS